MREGARRGLTPVLAFHLLTPLYDAVNGLLGYDRTFMRRVVAAASIAGSQRVLDVGCGTGALLCELARARRDILAIGLEPDPATLGIPQAKLAGLGTPVRLVGGVAQQLPFTDGSVDLVVSTMMFHHLASRAKRTTLREIHRILRDGGCFLLVDFGRPQSVLSGVLLRLGSLFDGQENLRANLAGLLPSYLEEAGFEVREVGQRYRGVQFLLGTKPSCAARRTTND